MFFRFFFLFTKRSKGMLFEYFQTRWILYVAASLAYAINRVYRWFKKDKFVSYNHYQNSLDKRSDKSRSRYRPQEIYFAIACHSYLREFLRMWILFERATCEVQKDTDREWYCVAFLWTTFDIKRNCFQRALFDFSRNWNAKGELQRSKIMFGKYHTLRNFSAARGFFYFPSCFYLACAGK